MPLASFLRVRGELIVGVVAVAVVLGEPVAVVVVGAGLVVDQAVAVVIEAVDDLGGAWEDGAVRVVAVALGLGKAVRVVVEVLGGDDVHVEVGGGLVPRGVRDGVGQRVLADRHRLAARDVTARVGRGLAQHAVDVGLDADEQIFDRIVRVGDRGLEVDGHVVAALKAAVGRDNLDGRRLVAGVDDHEHRREAAQSPRVGDGERHDVLAEGQRGRVELRHAVGGGPVRRQEAVDVALPRHDEIGLVVFGVGHAADEGQRGRERHGVAVARLEDLRHRRRVLLGLAGQGEEDQRMEWDAHAAA